MSPAEMLKGLFADRAAGASMEQALNRALAQAPQDPDAFRQAMISMLSELDRAAMDLYQMFPAPAAPAQADPPPAPAAPAPADPPPAQ